MLGIKLRFSASENNKIKVAILADYLDCGFLFDSKELNGYDVGFILTKRYPFFSFLYKGRWKKVGFLKKCKNFGEDSYQDLLSYCKENEIQYILIQAGDFLVPAYNYLNSHLNNKGNHLTAVKCSLDKNYMRDCLNKNNVSFVNKATIKNADDMKKINFYPCVVKPNIGTGSEGVVLVNSSEDMQKAFLVSQNEKRATEFETSFLVEEYIDGCQYDVEGILINGEVKILCVIAENYTGFFPCFNINWFLFNAEVSAPVMNKIKDTLHNAFDACGLKYGAFHCELKVNDSGDIKIIEFSNRMGGGFESSITHVTGNNFADLYVCSMLGKEVHINKNKNSFLLEKYFKSTSELNIWRSYLDSNKIDFTYKPWVTRGQIAVIKIWNDDKETMKKITENFGIA